MADTQFPFFLRVLETLTLRHGVGENKLYREDTINSPILAENVIRPHSQSYNAACPHAVIDSPNTSINGGSIIEDRTGFCASSCASTRFSPSPKGSNTAFGSPAWEITTPSMGGELENMRSGERRRYQCGTCREQQIAVFKNLLHN